MIMKYIIRILAMIPTLCVGIAMIVTAVAAIDYHLLVLVAIGLGFAFANGLSNYEETVSDLIHLLRLLCNKTPCYNE